MLEWFKQKTCKHRFTDAPQIMFRNESIIKWKIECEKCDKVRTMITGNYERDADWYAKTAPK